MTATSAEIQWFIAREGKQYGPVSDAEMQKLAELRHLKPGDLLWRPGFPEWRPATAVFPQPQPMQPKLSTQPPPASASQTQPANAAPYETQPARAEPQRHEPQAAPRPGFGGAPYETHQPVNQPGAHPAAGRPVAGQSATGQSPTTTGQGHGQPAPAANVGQQPMHNAQFPMPRQQFDPRRPGMQPGPGQGPVGSQPGQAQPPNMQRGPGVGPGMAQPQLGAAHGAEPMTAGRGKALAHVQPHQFEEETAAPAPRSRVRMLAAAVAVLLIAAGGGYILSTGGGSGLKAMMTAAGKPAAEVDPRAAPLDKLSDSTETLDANFQRTAMWVVVKKEFPEWYGDRLKEAAKLSADKSSEDAIAKHLVEQLVSLRRKNADLALAASTTKLKVVANAFLGNLKALASKSTDACYSFISQGETSPAVIEMMRSSEQNAAIQAQVAAIFEAIADGRKSPTTHSAPVKTDYDALADQLTKLGWSQTDLQLFADSRALAKAPPEKVCRMVQDWFTAHISIPDGEVQERLLVETLRPVVAG